jgi:hypothetical protein
MVQEYVVIAKISIVQNPFCEVTYFAFCVSSNATNGE